MFQVHVIAIGICDLRFMNVPLIVIAKCRPCSCWRGNKPSWWPEEIEVVSPSREKDVDGRSGAVFNLKSVTSCLC